MIKLMTKTNTLPISSIDVPDVSEKETRAIQSLIRGALEEKVDTMRKHKTRQEHNDAMVAVLNEFMKCYTIIGFDLSSEPLIITKANNPLDGEGLLSLQTKYFRDIIK